jgi:hypothetical protein
MARVFALSRRSTIGQKDTPWTDTTFLCGDRAEIAGFIDITAG